MQAAGPTLIAREGRQPFEHWQEQANEVSALSAKLIRKILKTTENAETLRSVYKTEFGPARGPAGYLSCGNVGKSYGAVAAGPTFWKLFV